MWRLNFDRRMRIAGIVVLLMLAACNRNTEGPAERGREAIRRYDCGSCHTVPGIREARGKVAPPLTYFSERSFIAGELPNSPDNLVRWIMAPREVEPKTAMPMLGVEEDEARDIAAYLYTLK